MEDGIVPLQVFVPIMESITAGTGNQNVYLKLDLGSMIKTTAEDDLFKDTENPPQNPNTGANIPTSTPDTGVNQPSPSPAGNADQSKSVVKAGQTVKIKGHTYTVTANGKVAFTKCKKNAKTVTIPATVKVNGVTCKVTSVAKNALKNNKKLTKVTFGKNVSKVGKNAFTGCKKLKTIRLPKGLSKKKKNAWKKQLKKAGVSSKVTIK
ncbi:MAG: leucine-rich repeat domain-containing protein [Lachnospiraceae bacterium]|nr:leucine-rich repeat domain-containing protein [Lachnospiraceae bacterium]